VVVFPTSQSRACRGHIAAWTIGIESLRFLWSEIRAGHTGTYGFRGYQFLANQLLTDRYSPKKKRVVAEFVAYSARKNGDSHALQIALEALWKTQ
jgi:hypothetical protein